jgi:exonuclease III
MKKIVKEIVRKDPDIIIFQEMGYESLGLIRSFMRKYDILNKYHGYGENFAKLTPNNMEQIIGRDLENYVFTKYIPESITQYTLSGNLGYSTGVTLVSYRDVVVVGCYLQAGSKHSPGQESVAHQYSRCRGEQIIAINNIIDDNYPNKTVILCGDFNMHLEIDDEEWPEVKEIQKLKFIDTWRSRYPDIISHPGFTEDTDINHMRWNMKFMEKHYRYDGILLRNNKTKLKVIKCKLVGLKSYPLDDDMFEEFMKVLSNKSNNKEPKSHTYHPSDHFGLMTTFII